MIDATRLMRGVVLALAILVAAPFTGLGGALVGVEAAQAQTVNRVDISGNQRVDDGTIEDQLTIGVGDLATGAELSRSTVALESTGLFRTVSVTFGGGTLRVKVTENPIIASVLFEGNERFSDANLMAMIDIGNRGAFTPERLDRDTESIRQAYVNDGFKSATVTPRVETVDNGRTRITFVINEGTRSGVAKVNFTGNNNISEGALKGVMKTKETSFLSWLFRDDTYSDAALTADAEMIRAYYNNHGYPDALVTYVAEYDASRNGYFVNFTITEGDEYEFGEISVETSIPGLDPDALRSTIRTQEGNRFEFQELQRSVEDMAFEATSQGFSFADVRPRIERDAATHRFNIVYLVDEGARIYVERIDITGNEKTRDFVIRRELDFAEGDPFNRSLVQRGKTNIEKLGYFSAVNVGVEQGSAADKIIINIAVVEQSTGDYGATAGYSTDQGLLGELSLTERNFLGRGQYLRVAVGISQAGRSFDLSFTEPRFMGLKISAGIDVYHRVVDETAAAFYGTTTSGGQLRFGLPVTRDLTAQIFTGYERKSIADVNAPIANPAIAVDGQVFNKAFVGTSLTYNTLDDQTRPTEGLLASFTVQYVGWSHNFLKTDVRARYFYPLLDDLGIVASVKGQAGIMNDFSGAGIHPTETYQFGPNLVRGFENRGMGPRLVSGEMVGNTMYAGGSLEVEMPVPILPESYGLSVAAWGDVAYIGGVGGAGLAIDPLSVDQSLKASVGASIIWHSPFGPLRGDFAYVISKATKDRTQLFQLTLQTLL